MQRPRRMSTGANPSHPRRQGRRRSRHGSFLRLGRDPRHSEEEMGAGWTPRRSRKRRRRRSSRRISSSSTRSGITVISDRPGIFRPRGRPLGKAAAEWLVAKKVKLVGVDSATIDHPLATSLGPASQRPADQGTCPKPTKDATGKDAIRTSRNGTRRIRRCSRQTSPTIENVRRRSRRGDRQARHLPSLPWFWREGDACVIRLMAFFDPSGNYRLESGERVVE